MRAVTYLRNTAVAAWVAAAQLRMAGRMRPMNRETSFASSDTLVVVDRSRRRRNIIIAAVVGNCCSSWPRSACWAAARSRPPADAGAGQRWRPGPDRDRRRSRPQPGRAHRSPLPARLPRTRDQPVGVAGEGGMVRAVLVDAGRMGPPGPGAGDRRPVGPVAECRAAGRSGPGRTRRRRAGAERI